MMCTHCKEELAVAPNTLVLFHISTRNVWCNWKGPEHFVLGNTEAEAEFEEETYERQD
jgi:hypothetical protein